MKASDLNLDVKIINLAQDLLEHVQKKTEVEKIESRSAHVIQAAINLLETINHTCTPEEAEYLEKKFFNSIKSRDPSKFARMLKSKMRIDQ